MIGEIKIFSMGSNVISSCLKCGGDVKLWDGKPKCWSCGLTPKKKAVVKEVSKAEVEALIASLRRAETDGIDYVGLGPQLRDEAQKLFSLVLSKPLNDWKEIEAELYRACVDFPGRREYVGLIHHNSLHRIEHSLSVLCELSQAQLTALGGVGKTLGAVKVGTSFAGLNAARQLGESMGEDMGEYF